MRLPDRALVVERLDAMIDETDRDDGAPGPAVIVVRVEGHRSNAATDPEGAERTAEAMAARIDRIVRSGDVIGRVDGDCFVVLAASLAPSAAGAVADRLRSVFAMPVELGDDMVSLVVEVAVEFAGPGRDAAEVLHRAESALGPR